MNNLGLIEARAYDYYKLRTVKFVSKPYEEDKAILVLETVRDNPAESRVFFIVRTISAFEHNYAKDYVSGIIKKFVDVKRIDFTTKSFAKIDSMLDRNNIVLLRSDLSLSGVERHKAQYSLDMVNKKLKAFKEPFEVLPYSFKELNNMEETPQVKYSKLIRSKYHYEKKLERVFVSDNEYRNFYSVRNNKMPNASNTEVETYDLPKTSERILIVSLQLRANDSLYFCMYDTLTQETTTTMNYKEIKQILLNNLNTLIITDYVASIQLQAIANGVSIVYKTTKAIQKELEALKVRNYPQIETVTGLLSATAKPDFVERQCYKYMRVNVKHSEGNNCLQHLENLKFLFATQLKDLVASKITMLKVAKGTANAKRLTNEVTISHIAETIFHNKQENKYVYNFDALIANNNLSTIYDAYTFLSDVDDDANSEFSDFEEYKDEEGTLECKRHKFDKLGITLSTGPTGFGGLAGSVSNYTNPEGTKVVHLDFASFYPTILRTYNKAICNIIDMEMYNTMYYKKFSQCSAGTKAYYKNLINTTIGILGSEKDKFKMKSRDSWKAIIKIGQLTMLNLLFHLDSKGYKILSVNTDGCYIEVPSNEKVEVKHQFPLSIKEYKKIYVRSVNDYILLGADNRYVVKGKFKHMDCEYVTSIVVAKLLYGVDYKHTKPKDISELYTYSREKQSRLLHYNVMFTDYEFDTRGMEYVNNYKQNNPDKGIKLDVNHYFRLADNYVYN